VKGILGTVLGPDQFGPVRLPSAHVEIARNDAGARLKRFLKDRPEGQVELLPEEEEDDVRVRKILDVEDVGLALGTALDQALGERRGIRRYGFFLLPMDESLAQVALDLGGRPFLAYANGVNSSFVRDFDTNLFEEFFRALCVNARMNLHVRVDGNEAHHAIEGVFKGFARALREAIEADPRDAGIPSSKGVL